MIIPRESDLQTSFFPDTQVPENRDTEDDPRQVPRYLKVLCAVAVCGLVSLVGLAYQVYKEVAPEYSELRPNVVFRRIFRQDIPKGVNNLKIAGRGRLMAGQACMSFTAEPSIFKAMCHRSGQEWTDETHDVRTASGPASDEDASAIGWPPAPVPLSYRYYSISTRTSQGWFGDCLVDPQANRIYIIANLL